MNTDKALESDFLSVGMIKNSPTRKCLILGEGESKEMIFENKKKTLVFLPINIDGKEKTWRLNKPSIKNMQELGHDSKSWIGRTVDLKITEMAGKECILGFPIFEKKPEEIRAKELMPFE